MKKLKSCCFIGHRKLEDREKTYAKTSVLVRELIVNEGVRAFNFGSKSQFDDIGYDIVSTLKEEFPDLIRINYHRKSEYVVQSAQEKALLEKSLKSVAKRESKLKVFERSIMSERVCAANKASYVERNEDMINDSDYCVFYYAKDYEPENNVYYKSSGKSGTRLAYDYAVKAQKKIINIAEIV